MKCTNIYILIDPLTKEARYVGKANKVDRRYKAHLNRARKHQSHKRNWINSLREKGLKPVICVIDEVPIDDWPFWENYWICQFKAWGFDLVNHTYGGEGTTFGNQTSFKKGDKPWNYGTANTEICLVCEEEFKAHKSSNRKYCSRKCYHEDVEDVKSRFSEGHEPWNKGLANTEVCVVCNKEFKAAKGQNAKCCSRKCFSKYFSDNHPRKRKVKQYDKNMKFIKEYNSIEGAKKETGAPAIGNVLAGKAKTSGGFKWRYSQSREN